jgi:hypothetical protein
MSTASPAAGSCASRAKVPPIVRSRSSPEGGGLTRREALAPVPLRPKRARRVNSQMCAFFQSTVWKTDRAFDYRSVLRYGAAGNHLRAFNNGG